MENKIIQDPYDGISSFLFFLTFLRYKIDHDRVKQKNIARAIDVRPEYVNRIYKGRQTCSVEVQEKICRYFGVSYMEALADGRHIVETGELPAGRYAPPENKPAGVPVERNRRATDPGGETDVVTLVAQLAAKKKETEAALATLQNTLENLSDGFVILDANLVVRYQNRSHREMFGASLVGHACPEVHSGELHRGDCPSLLSVRTGMPATTVFQYGKAVVSASATPVRDISGRVTGYVEVWRDMTGWQRQRILAEQSLDMLDRAVFACDEQGRILLFNAQLREITGAGDADLVTMATFHDYLQKNGIVADFAQLSGLFRPTGPGREGVRLEVNFSDGGAYLYSFRPVFSGEVHVGGVGVFIPAG